MDIFRVRLNCLDYYQATPTRFDPPVPLTSRNGNIKHKPRVSVIRIFGATETGQKVLVHVHGAFQYCYIEYSGGLGQEEVEVAILTLQQAIDHALCVSYRKNPNDGKYTYVAHISLVKGTPFYGFYVGYKLYLKIYLLNPLHMTRLADLLREGAVMKRVLQPYESHMQYLAQWMCDYNLFGCGYIDCRKVTFRAPVPNAAGLNTHFHLWHSDSIAGDDISDEQLLPKSSHCPLEADLCVEDILNRQDVKARPLHHDFIERIHPLPLDTKFVQSMAGLWKDETRRRKTKLGLTDASSSPFPPEDLMTMSADPRNLRAGGWIHEQEYRDKVDQIVRDESKSRKEGSITFGKFVDRLPSEDHVRTALESVEDLFSCNLPSTEQISKSERRAIVETSEADGERSPASEKLIRDESKADFKNSLMVDRTTSEISRPSTPVSAAVQVPLKSVTPSQYARLGIRHVDSAHDSQGDFVVPSDFVVSEAGSEQSLSTDCERGETSSQSHNENRQIPIYKDLLQPPKKKRKVLVDEQQSLPGLHYDATKQIDDSSPFLPRDSVSKALDVRTTLPFSENTSLSQPASQQSGSQSERSLRNSRISFPIVKDAHDPNTIARLSQQSSSPTKSGYEQESKPFVSTSTSQETKARLSASVQSNHSSSEAFPLLKKLPTGVAAISSPNTTLVFAPACPSFNEVSTSAGAEDIPAVIYRSAYYSNEGDVPDKPRQYAGREFKLESDTIPYLPDFNPTGTSPAVYDRKVAIALDSTSEKKADFKQRRLCNLKYWEIGEAPPSRREVESWLANKSLSNDTSTNKQAKTSTFNRPLSQIDGPTQRNTHGFKYSQRQKSTSVQYETQYMNIMSLEVHVNSRGNLAPDPESDEVSCIFWCVQSDDEDSMGTDGDSQENICTGILVKDDTDELEAKLSRSTTVEVEAQSTEIDLLTRITDIVRNYDPDILTGYEVHNSSWGYLIERARLKYGLDLCDEISRMKSQSHGRFGKEADRWGFNQTSTIRVTGRHTINIWRAMRGELNLLQYTMENVAFHLLHRRIPHYGSAQLTRWFQSGLPSDLAKVTEYFVSRVRMDLEILEANELVPRTSEQARLLGVDWFSVISRGSQFKVESLMFRIAKPENFIIVSPSRRQVGGQNALECLPLVMEPQSDFYTSPLLVLDFQSLYPSVMIAYNYCYSTFLGRVVGWRGTNKMGFTNYERKQRLVELLKDHINIAPNGIMYAKPHIRKSLLAKMLAEILETRVMVKSGMKADKDDKTLQRLLNNRQLALKLIANVTYGYTSASFSGRMPCSEIADSIVQTGRETLERTIAFIHSVEKWGAEVVYGDTDSLFVYLKGRTKEQAFDIGEDIVRRVTDMNPRPVKLKFEKVYQPCVLLAKKRYVGFKYEHRNQVEPDFEAKGIETVRRDGTPAEQKIEEKALKILFKTADLSQVKDFFQQQCGKIMRGKVSIQDFCFAREVKLGSYSDKGPPPPGALISARKMVRDPRLEPQYGERVPYVVITGGPKARLIDRCVAPEVLLKDAQLELDAEYYITKNLIPPLERIFNLVGANVRQWYDEMPKFQPIRRVEGMISEPSDRMATVAMVTNGSNNALAATKKTLESYMKSSACMVCRRPLPVIDGSGSGRTTNPFATLCPQCLAAQPETIFLLRSQLVKTERKVDQLNTICRSCSGMTWSEPVRCDSKDCPVFYSRMRQNADLTSTQARVEPLLRSLEEGMDAMSLQW